MSPQSRSGVAGISTRVTQLNVLYAAGRHESSALEVFYQMPQLRE
jgi:hypothetical protein